MTRPRRKMAKLEAIEAALFGLAGGCFIVWIGVMGWLFVTGNRYGWLSDRVFFWETVSFIPIEAAAINLLLWYAIAYWRTK